MAYISPPPPGYTLPPSFPVIDIAIHLILGISEPKVEILHLSSLSKKSYTHSFIMPGGMGVKKNIHIEEWASFRENCEHVFKFSKANFARLAVFGIAVPVGMYYWITYEFVRFHLRFFQNTWFNGHCPFFLC